MRELTWWGVKEGIPKEMTQKLELTARILLLEEKDVQSPCDWKLKVLQVNFKSMNLNHPKAKLGVA